MNKNKKIIISVSVIIIIVILGVAIYFAVQTSKNNQNIEEKTNSKLSKLYQEMSQDNTYNVSLVVDNDNKVITKRKGNKARIEVYKNGDVQTYIVKDGDTYLLRNDDKKYFKYQNNTIKLTELLGDINNTVQSQQPKEGKEEVNGKNYNYEEYKGIDSFLIQNSSAVNNDNLSTKFYFEGNNLKYINTKSDNINELVKVDISYNVNDNEFDIPSDYTEG